jgi:hypothetical protein
MPHRWADEYEDQINYDESKATKAKKKAAEPIKLKDESSWFDTIDVSLVAFIAVFMIVLSLVVITRKGSDYVPLTTTPATEPAKPAPKTYKEPGSARDIFQENFNR